MALHDSVSTPNSRPEHGRMSGSGSQILGGMCRMPDLTKPPGKSCDSLLWAETSQRSRRTAPGGRVRITRLGWQWTVGDNGGPGWGFQGTPPPEPPTATTNRAGSRASAPRASTRERPAGEPGRRPASTPSRPRHARHRQTPKAAPNSHRTRTTNRNHQSRGFRGARPPGPASASGPRASPAEGRRACQAAASGAAGCAPRPKGPQPAAPRPGSGRRHGRSPLPHAPEGKQGLGGHPERLLGQ